MRSAPARSPLGYSPPGRSGLRRALPLAVALATLALIAAGCQSSNLTSGHGTGTTVVTVAAIEGVDNAPLYIAQRNGAFARAGLDVKIKPYPSVAQELQALSKGKVDVAAGDYVDFFALAAKSRHPYLSIIADGYHAAPGVMEVLTYPGSGITKPQDLVGRTVGTPQPESFGVGKATPYSLETVATWSVLSNDGVDPQAVNWKPMPAATLVNELASHQVAAILVNEPYIYQAESKLGAIAVLDSCSGATANLPLSGYFATSASVRDHQATYRTFRKVLQQAQKSAVLPGPVRAELARVPGMSPESAALVTIGAYPTTLNAAGLQRVIYLMFNSNMLNSSPNVRSMIAS